MGRLAVALIAYAAAALAHHAHNAHFLDHYPNMPAWLSPAGVYLAWLLATAVGAAGYVLLRGNHRALGMAALFCYGVYGLDALLHYLVAPFSAHTPAMHATIAMEAATAAVLLATLAWIGFSSRSAR